MNLVVIFGPPAVGKMTVGAELAGQGGYRLFHNHAAIEPVLDVFEFGTPPFNRLVTEIRQRVLEEAAAAGVDLVMTFVWGLEHDGDRELMQSYVDIYERAGGTVAFVELVADLDTRLVRNRTEQRLLAKKSKRDVEWSDQNVRELDEHVLNTGFGDRTVAEDLLDQHRHLRLDNTNLEPAEAAKEILTWLSQP